MKTQTTFRTCLAAIATAAVLAVSAAAQESDELIEFFDEVAAVLVHHPSYEVPVTREERFRGLIIREQLKLLFKLTGHYVAQDGALPPERFAFDLNRIESRLDLAGLSRYGADLLVAILHDQSGGIRVRMVASTDEGMVDPRDDVFRSDHLPDLPYLEWEFPPESKGSTWGQLCRHFGVANISSQFINDFDAGELGAPDALELGYRDRLAAIDEASEDFLVWEEDLNPSPATPTEDGASNATVDDGDLDEAGAVDESEEESVYFSIASSLRLARLSLLHGCHERGLDELVCLEFGARALAFAEVAAYALPEHEGVGRFRDEIGFLASHFMLHERAETLLVGEAAILPEFSRFLQRSRLPLAEWTGFERVRDVWDLLLGTEARFYGAGLKGMMDNLPDSVGPLDRVLRQSRSNSFNANQHAEQIVSGILAQADQTLPEIEMRALTQNAMRGDEFEGADFQNAFSSALEEGDESSILWEMLDPVATGEPPSALESSTGRAFLRSLAFLKQFSEVEAELDDLVSEVFTSRISPQWLDLRAGFIRRHLRLLHMTMWRQNNIGNDSGELFEDLLARFGTREWNDATLPAEPFQFSWNKIASPAIFEEEIVSQLGRSVPTPASLILGYAKDGQALEEAFVAGDLAATDRSAFAVAVDAALADPSFYSPQAFGNVLQTDTHAEAAEFIADPPTDPLAVQAHNLSLFHLAFPEALLVPPQWIRTYGLAYRQLLVRERAAEAFYRDGRFQDAHEIYTDVLPMTHPDDGLLPTAIANSARVSDEALNEVLAEVALLCSSGFALDRHRKRVLYWSFDEFDFRADAERWLGENTTNSSRDYLGRAEFAFRRRDFAEVHSILRQYHYTGSRRVSLLLELSDLLVKVDSDEAIAVEEWDRLEALLAADIRIAAKSDDDEMDGGYYDYWLRILDEEFIDQPAWAAVRGAVRLVDLAELARIRRQLFRPSNVGLLKEMTGWLSRLNEGIADESASTWEDERWKLLALELEHDAVAQWILATTGNLESEPDDALLTRARALMQRTREVTPRFEEIERSFNPVALRLLFAMARLGVAPEKIAAFAESLGPLAGFIAAGSNSSRALAIVVDEPELLSVLLQTRREALPEWHETAFEPLIDLRYLYRRAIESGKAAVACDLAIEIALTENDFKPLAALFPDSRSADEWIAANALSSSSARRWRADVDADAVVISNQPEVPDLVSYLRRFSEQ